MNKIKASNSNHKLNTFPNYFKLFISNNVQKNKNETIELSEGNKVNRNIQFTKIH